MSKIKFIASTNEVFSDFPHPQPSNQFTPKWYKEMPSLIGNEKKIYENRNGNLTLKRCVPFRDSMFAGYMIPLPFDIYVTKQNKKIVVNCSYFGDFIMVDEHQLEQYFMYPIPEGYDVVALKWNNPWIIKTPRNWSTLFVNPIHHDVPFYTLSGLVDTDKHPVPVALPFFIKKDFEGIIEKGTPIVQCIPIKRKNFVGYVVDKMDSLWSSWRKTTTQAFDRYRDNYHTIKSYKMIENKEAKCPFSIFFKK